MTDRIDQDVLVVGIDVGLTCTGVAFALLPATGASTSLGVVSNWPSPADAKVRVGKKVRTALHYRAGHDGALTWGETCPAPEDLKPGEDVITWFKLKLDDKRQNGEKSSPIEDVRKWYKEFLVEVRHHVEKYFSDELGFDLNSIRVDYVFSVPTTWAETPLQEFRAIIRESGFGPTADIGLSEGEATAVFTARGGEFLFEPDDTLLVCDAGGGTTDVCILQITEINDHDILVMRRMITADGQTLVSIEIGAVQIDEAFIKFIDERLDPIRKTVSGVPDHAARTMLEKRFQPLKDLPKGLPGNPSVKLVFDVPGLQDYSNPEAMIENGLMTIPRDLAQCWLDRQIEGITKHIDKQLQRLPEGERVSYFVLSGGFGSSEYVREAISRKYREKGMKIVAPKDPQLSVCKGLVLDQVQRVLHQKFTIRPMCTVSYGLVLAERYESRRHKEQRPERGPVDGMEYAINQIDWFIHKGENITCNSSIILPICHKVSPEGVGSRWNAQVVVSDLPPEGLPTSLPISGNNVRVVREIVTHLPTGHFILDNPDVALRKRNIFPGSKRFWKVKYEFVAVADMSALSFEVRFQGTAINDYAGPVRLKTSTQIDTTTLGEPAAVGIGEWFNGPIRRKR